MQTTKLQNAGNLLYVVWKAADKRILNFLISTKLVLLLHPMYKEAFEKFKLMRSMMPVLITMSRLCLWK